jgi:NAD+-dependent secondary alcohol dehydrogenase Adh1
MSATKIIVLDRSQAALDLVRGYGADETVLADENATEKVLDLTNGDGAEVVFDFVAEQGAEALGWNLTRRAGSHYIIGYGGTISVPAIDVISSERNIVGNLVGTYTDLAELMALTAQGKVELHTRTYSLDAVNDAMDDLDAGRLQGRGILVPG